MYKAHDHWRKRLHNHEHHHHQHHHQHQQWIKHQHGNDPNWPNVLEHHSHYQHQKYLAMSIISRKDKEHPIIDHQEMVHRYSWNNLSTYFIWHDSDRKLVRLQLVMDVSSKVNHYLHLQRLHLHLLKTKAISSFVLVTLAISISTGTKILRAQYSAKSLEVLYTTLLKDKGTWKIWWWLQVWRGKCLDFIYIGLILTLIYDRDMQFWNASKRK